MGTKCISITKAKSGMILAKPVLDEKGRTLCAEKTELTGKLLVRFENMGIQTVYIEFSETLSQDDFERELHSLNNRFINIKDGSLLGKLKTILIDRLEKRKN